MPAAEMQSFRATTPDLLRGERGWMSQIKTAAPGGGRKMFLTSPFIDEAFALRTRCQRIRDLSPTGPVRYTIQIRIRIQAMDTAKHIIKIFTEVLWNVRR